MSRSTVHYADNKTNNALKALHNKLRPAGTPVQRVEYIIELLLLRIFETKLKQDDEFKPLRELFSTDYKWLNPKTGKEESNENRLFSYLSTVSNDQILSELNDNFFPFYSNILHSARKVFKGNLPQKVQDQLVLIEEVFSNSNFTNNVNSGNLGEVINIVANEIEGTRLLKTDLLGDAIESALSETGGTKDVGLFRTPDHVRQFMTALIEPTFDDIIFDPACGTGGFLFDAFEFVMRRVDSTREWPGEKAHSELADWFDSYFEKNQIEFPSIEQTTQFYRSGVTGVEYLGMIRKMAAINFYIRGLNPANIEQGDSLAKYHPVTDHETKSIILANPPFGAQRDQEAYPDVWSEYSKESETTILFVKLMFEHLKQGGQCAVIVSEGFHTWDQFSAKTLRKMLLEEAQLKAVISLPQGLFVSKNGQGPKTSILVFEKGGKTDWTWFYKITNDGYTMGTNRKEQKGNQLVECLSLYHKFVKHGNKPEETKNQFCIPAEWVKTLDPRIKEKIRTETRTDMEAKGRMEKVKKAQDLDKKVKAQKITEADKQMELKVFDQMLENRIQNEIAKRIDKAHSYSFNFANYKSTLSDSQIAEWRETLKHIQPNGPTTLDEVYKTLANSKTGNILPYLLKLNPANALEADIAREYLSNLDNNLILKHKELNIIKEILKSKQKYPSIKLKDILTEYQNFVQIDNDRRYKQLTVSNSGEVKLRAIVKGDEIATKRQNEIVDDGSDYLIYSRLGLHTGSIGYIPFGLIDSIVSTDFPVFKSTENIKYLAYILQSQIFVDKIIEKNPTGAAQQRFHQEDFLEIEIPLPSFEDQDIIIAEIEKQREIIDGVDKVLCNWKIQESDFIREGVNYTNLIIDDFASVGTGSTPSREIDEYFKGENNWVLTTEVAMNEISVTSEKLSDKAIQDYGLRVYPKNTILIAMYGQGKTRGQSAYLQIPASITQNCGAIVVDEEKAVPKYVWYYLMSIYDEIRGQDYSGGGVPHLNLTIVKQIRVPLPDISIQEQIVNNLNLKMQILDGLSKMKTEAQKKIDKILADVWGVDYVESVKKEIEYE